LLPQLVPFWMLDPALHSGVPVEQLIEPFLHGLLGVHEVPLTQV
jgi:hypothetical protein